MTAAAPARGARPPKPRAGLAVPLGLLGFLAMTAWAVSKEFGIGVDLLEIAEDLSKGGQILQELAPDWRFLPNTAGPMLETFQMAIIATALGCAVALPFSFLASRVTAPNWPVLATNRVVLSVVRAIPDILYALVFVAAVGIGPLPGILALFFFNIGVVAKLLSETVDGVDPGPIEAARASGGGRVQTIRWAVLPQVLPNYVAYSLYVFELNVRASVVIGIVGAGGIGQLLNTQLKFFNYGNVGVIIVELFIAVFLIEQLSIWLRRKLV